MSVLGLVDLQLRWCGLCLPEPCLMTIVAFMINLGLEEYYTISRIRNSQNTIGNYIGPYITPNHLGSWTLAQSLVHAPKLIRNRESLELLAHWSILCCT